MKFNETKIINDGESGQRLDKFLRKRFPEVHLSALFKLIRKGKIRINEKRVAENYRIQTDDVLSYPADFKLSSVPDVVESAAQGENQLQVIYLDEYYLVVNKPAGVSIHPNPTTEWISLQEQVDWYVKNNGIETHGFRVSPVYRIDRVTSGLMVFALSSRAFRVFAEAASSQQIKKEYLTLCEGRLQKRGLLEDYVDYARGKASQSCQEKGKKCSLIVVSGMESDQATLLKIQLITGRKHQIRFQLNEQGSPVLNDRFYTCGQFSSFIFLHAWHMQILSPEKELSGLQKQNLYCPIPDYFQNKIEELNLSCKML